MYPPGKHSFGVLGQSVNRTVGVFKNLFLIILTMPPKKKRRTTEKSGNSSEETPKIAKDDAEVLGIIVLKIDLF